MRRSSIAESISLVSLDLEEIFLFSQSLTKLLSLYSLKAISNMGPIEGTGVDQEVEIRSHKSSSRSQALLNLKG